MSTCRTCGLLWMLLYWSKRRIFGICLSWTNSILADMVCVFISCDLDCPPVGFDLSSSVSVDDFGLGCILSNSFCNKEDLDFTSVNREDIDFESVEVFFAESSSRATFLSAEGWCLTSAWLLSIVAGSEGERQLRLAAPPALLSTKPLSFFFLVDEASLLLDAEALPCFGVSSKDSFLPAFV